MWHVNPKTYNVAVCRAHVKECPFGEQQHFANSEKAYESIYETLPTLRRHQEEYQSLASNSIDYTRSPNPNSSTSPYQDAKSTLEKNFDFKTLFVKFGAVASLAAPAALLNPISAPLVLGGALALTAAAVVSEVRKARKERKWKSSIIEAVEERKSRADELIASLAEEAKLSPQESALLIRSGY